jgi:alcohol dehydrogenase, propanol-preferring
MLAYRLLKEQTQPEFQEVPEPRAGPGQVVVKVAGSGLCHTDFTVMSRDRGYWKDDPPPFTLGHEIAGWVEELGTGVKGFQRGEAVAVNPSWASCGRCHMCRSGEENHCLLQKAIRAPGVGYDGGHAPYVLVPEARFLVPTGNLDPVQAAPLTDAGLTTYAVIKSALPGIYPGGTAVVIGIGGLGLYAVQFLRQLTGARVVAVDSSEARLKLAREYGADDVVTSGPAAADQIREHTGGIGAAFVLDCVGVNATLATGVAALSWRGRLAMVGAGGGSIPFDFFKMPPGAQLVTSLNGGSVALKEVLDMAALGRIRTLVDRYPLSAAKQAYDDFEHGRLVGRAVVIP